MAVRIHDDEFDTSESVARSLLADQVPELAACTLVPVHGTGTSNALWRLDGADGAPAAILRLPRTAGAITGLRTEIALLPALQSTAVTTLVEVPRLLHVGRPAVGFDRPWALTDWVPGRDVWDARERVAAAGPALAADLAAVVAAIRASTGLPAPRRKPGRRGGPLGAVLQGLERWLSDDRWKAPALVDVAAIRRLADEARELVDAPVPTTFLHGDLIPGNLLVDDRSRLRAVIDWGGAGHGDPADDLVAAWAVFDDGSRRTFRDHLTVDDATWLRARTVALEQAVGGVLYYTPRRNPLGEVMRRTLDRILSEA